MYIATLVALRKLSSAVDPGVTPITSVTHMGKGAGVSIAFLASVVAIARFNVPLVQSLVV